MIDLRASIIIFFGRYYILLYNKCNEYIHFCVTALQKYSIENSVIKPAHMLTCEGATELLYMNLEQERKNWGFFNKLLLFMHNGVVAR